jgi:glycosyltransferase involved in cell wall biosynthesis
MLTLSLIAPAYNEAAHIIPFLESVTAQAETDFELILVDDGSSDGTADIIAAHLPRLGRRVRFLRHQENQGERATVAEAFSYVTSDICLKVDTDSVLEPGIVARIMEVFAADPQVGVVTAFVKALDQTTCFARGAEVLCIAQQRCDQLPGGYTRMAYGSCFAFRRPIFSADEVASRWDLDLAQEAQKRGWKIALLPDAAVRTCFPDTLRGVFARGRRAAQQELPTHWRHKGLLLTHWGFWLKFAPLGLALLAPFKPRWALAGLLAWLGGSQVFLARVTPDYPLADRLAAWGVTLVRWSGFDMEMIRLGAQAAGKVYRTR